MGVCILKIGNNNFKLIEMKKDIMINVDEYKIVTLMRSKFLKIKFLNEIKRTRVWISPKTNPGILLSP